MRRGLLRRRAPPVPDAWVLVAPDSVVAGKAFSLRIDARNATGQPDLDWRGSVALSASAGGISPASVQLANGSVTVQVTLTRAAGTVTVQAAVGSVQASTTTLALSGEPVVRLEVVPRAFLLPHAGDTIRLAVRAYDANDQPTVAQVAWQTSNPSMVTVSPAARFDFETMAGAKVVHRPRG